MKAAFFALAFFPVLLPISSMAAEGMNPPMFIEGTEFISPVIENMYWDEESHLFVPIDEGQEFLENDGELITPDPEYPFQGDGFPSDWRWPFSGCRTISLGYGKETHINQDYHALDWNGPGSSDCDAPVLAAQSGIVVFTGWAGCYGNTIIVQSFDGFLYRVAHLNSIYVGPNRCVERGQPIGATGSTPGGSCSTGCHIHFVVYNGSYIGGGNISGYSVPVNGIDGDWDLRVGWKYCS